LGKIVIGIGPKFNLESSLFTEQTKR
jgi:hypothetical protein